MVLRVISEEADRTPPASPKLSGGLQRRNTGVDPLRRTGSQGEMRSVFGKLIGRANGSIRKAKSSDRLYEDGQDAGMSPSKRDREESFTHSPMRKQFRQAPLSPTSIPPTTPPLLPLKSRVPTTGPLSPNKSRDHASQSLSTPVKAPIIPSTAESPLEVNLKQFDELFRDFSMPMPPARSVVRSSETKTSALPSRTRTKPRGSDASSSNAHRDPPPIIPPPRTSSQNPGSPTSTSTTLLSPKSPARSHTSLNGSAGSPPGRTGDNRFEKCLERFEDVFADLRAEAKSQEERRERMLALEKDAKKAKYYADYWKRKSQELKAALAGQKEAMERKDREYKELENTLEKEREGKGKAAAEAKGMIAHLERRLAKEQEERKQVEDLLSQRRVADAQSERRAQDLQARLEKTEQQLDEALAARRADEALGDRRLFEMQQRLDAAMQTSTKAEQAFKAREAEMQRLAREKEEEMSRAYRTKEVAWRAKLEESEFAHRALKEGGARLARELERSQRHLEEEVRERQSLSAQGALTRVKSRK